MANSYVPAFKKATRFKILGLHQRLDLLKKFAAVLIKNLWAFVW